jgi:endonuclease/exonuclease/phosphatase family metal-dependent hydrolase
LQYRFIVSLIGLSFALAPPFNVPRELKLLPDSASSSKTLQIVSWNIDHGSRLETIAGELSQPASPGLCLLQEVDWNAARSGTLDVAAELARKLRLNMSYGIEFEELSQEHGQPAYIGQATLTRLPIRRSRVLRFARQSSFWQPHAWIPSNLPLMQRRLGSRIALVTDLEWNGQPLVVYNAHLESRSMGEIQGVQLDEILADLKSYPAATSAIIGGDLNSKYFPSGVLRKLQQQGFQSALGQKVQRTHAIAMALDWIFVRGPFAWRNGAVRRDFKGSDHYPIDGTLTQR